jgi:hypothetical protein
MTNAIHPGTLRIGITLGLQHAAEELWNNGIKQNAVFLMEALKRCPQVASVGMVNMTAVPITPSLGWDLSRWPVFAFADVKDDLDLLIELGGQVGPAETEHIKARGTRLVSYCCGSEYVAAAQSVLFGRPTFGSHLFVNRRYDAIWMIPQVANLSEAYFTTLRRRPAQVVPFVWDPVLFVQASQAYAHAGEYRPRSGARRVTICEPNVDVVKFCLYPVFVVEEAYRRAPELLAFLHVTNAERLATESPPFVALMSQLDIVRQHKAAFVRRHATPQFLAEMTDVLVSHQWENPLNYLYLEACWQGYPLVHNASLCSDLGYYYEGNDVTQGAQQLLRAMSEHDSHWEAYRDAQRSRIERFRPHDDSVTAAYTDLLERLMAQPLV